MAGRIVRLSVRDVRFPTSESLDGSDAMHAAPDYSAAYVVLEADAGATGEGHGLAFTLGRGTEVVLSAVRALEPLLIGADVEEIFDDFAGFWRKLTSDGQLRWLGPEKGVIHLATAAVINALWDLRAKLAGQPLWRLLCDLSPEQIVSSIDFRYITDALRPEEARDLLQDRLAGKARRVRQIEEDGYPAYTTSAGWLGYSDEKLRRLCQEACEGGFSHLKMKVGADLEDDLRRASIIREIVGPDIKLMMDANQRWDVAEAIESMTRLAAFNPWWIEEPTSPDDVLGHAAVARAIAPIRVATGEACQNRVIFKQLLQSRAIGFCQIDSCRVGGVNENLAIMLMAAKFQIPVCPHAGGVGLCEHVQHLSMFDYIGVSAQLEDRIIEYVDHLHEHFVDPVTVRDGCYVAPTQPGYSIAMKPESLAEYEFPNGAAWRRRRAGVHTQG